MSKLPLAPFLAVAALPGACATPRIPEADRTWTCAALRYLPRGTIEGRLVLSRDGRRRGGFELEWRGQIAEHGWIGLRWRSDSVTAPPDDARAALSFTAANPPARRMRLELRRGAADGPAMMLFPWAGHSVDRPARWGDVLAAGRHHGFFAVVVGPEGRVLAGSRVEADALAEPARAAALLREELEPMVADHERRCQLSPERVERITVT